MKHPMRWLVCAMLLCGPVTACGGDDDDDDSAAGTGGKGGSGQGGSSGSQSSDSGSGAAGSKGNTAGTSSNAGSGGSGSDRDGSMASSGSGADDSGADADTGDDDSGTQNPGDALCKAPEVAASAGNTCPTDDPVTLTLTPIKSGLSVPVFVTSAPDDDTRLFVVERGGTILVIEPDGDDIGEFMTVPDVAASDTVSGEMGLLGFAFHPQYPDDPRFFVNYTSEGQVGGQRTVIASFEVRDDDPDQADPDSFQPVLEYVQPQGNHNGGMVAFGPDGCLFIGSGDGGNSDDQGNGHPDEGNGQNLDTHLGKLLRLDVDDPTSGAPGNLEGGGNPHIWDYGLRNPWRFSFDRMTGDLYIGDVGQGAWEEVDVEAKGDGKKNYGWKITEGAHCRPNGPGSCDMNGLVAPVDEYPHGGGDDCIVGGYVYRGTAIPSLQGFYVYGDNGPGRKIRAFTWDGDGRCGDETLVISDRDNIDLPDDITSFGQDDNGELYVTTSTSVYRIDAAP